MSDYEDDFDEEASDRDAPANASILSVETEAEIQRLRAQNLKLKRDLKNARLLAKSKRKRSGLRTGPSDAFAELQNAIKEAHIYRRECESLRRKLDAAADYDRIQQLENIIEAKNRELSRVQEENKTLARQQKILTKVGEEMDAVRDSSAKKEKTLLGDLHVLRERLRKYKSAAKSAEEQLKSEQAKVAKLLREVERHGFSTTADGEIVRRGVPEERRRLREIVERKDAEVERAKRETEVATRSKVALERRLRSALADSKRETAKLSQQIFKLEKKLEDKDVEVRIARQQARPHYSAGARSAPETAVENEKRRSRLPAPSSPQRSLHAPSTSKTPERYGANVQRKHPGTLHSKRSKNSALSSSAQTESSPPPAAAAAPVVLHSSDDAQAAGQHQDYDESFDFEDEEIAEAPPDGSDESPDGDSASMVAIAEPVASERASPERPTSEGGRGGGGASRGQGQDTVSNADKPRVLVSVDANTRIDTSHVSSGVRGSASHAGVATARTQVLAASRAPGTTDSSSALPSWLSGGSTGETQAPPPSITSVSNANGKGGSMSLSSEQETEATNAPASNASNAIWRPSGGARASALSKPAFGFRKK